MSDISRLLWERLLKEFAQSSPLDLMVKLAAAIIVAATIYILQKLLRRVSLSVARTLGPWWACSRKIARARQAVDEHGPGLWLAIKQEPSKAASARLKETGKLILTIANLKGGVGKTTLTANLAAYFANPHRDAERSHRNVLVIDLDFQGSCSSMLFANQNWRPKETQLSPASQLINGATTSRYRGQIGAQVVGVERARGVAAFYDLAGVENSEMVRWLIGDESQDIRYRLAEFLLSDAVLPHFDVILIDAPPRLTTASVQALCASTHVLIPTILDPLSADAVGYFGRQLKAHDALWPHLKIMGVVGTMTDRRRADPETRALTTSGDRLRSAVEGSASSLRHIHQKGLRFELPYECSVFERASLARAAGQGIAYVASATRDRDEAREVFDPLGKEIEKRWLHL